MLIAGSRVGRTARSPCNPRDVVIVQGFRGHFANAWPRTDRICGEWNLGTCDRKSGSPVRRERDRFCSAVKQPATTTACLLRPKVRARNGDVNDKAARGTGNRAGIWRRVGCRGPGRPTNAAARREAEQPGAPTIADLKELN